MLAMIVAVLGLLMLLAVGDSTAAHLDAAAAASSAMLSNGKWMCCGVCVCVAH